MLLCLVGCDNKSVDTPESAAEKYLSDLKSDLLEIGFYNPRKHDNRSLVLMENEQADSIISGGKIPTMSELFDKYFQDDKHFYRWELMDISNDTINIYNVWDFTRMSDAERKTRLEMLDKGYFGEPVKTTDVAAVMIAHKGVPKYAIKYKIDSRHIDFVGDEYKTAEVSIIKHPEKGYKAISFTWEE